MLSDTTAAADAAAAPPEAATERPLAAPRPRYLIALTGPHTERTACAVHLTRYGYRPLAFAHRLCYEVAESYDCGGEVLTHRATHDLPIGALSIGHCWRPEFVAWCNDRGDNINAPRSARWLLAAYEDWRCSTEGPAYWINIVCRQIDSIFGGLGQRIVITDLRDRAEHEAIATRGGKLLRVVRTDGRASTAGVPATWAAAAGQRPPVAPDEVHCDGTLQHMLNDLERVVTLHWGPDALTNTRAAAQ